jgi:hypothetical protein
MSDTCPNITEEQLASKMGEIINNNPEMKTVINTALETCDITGGRKGRKGKMLKGGDRKGLIKGVLYTIIAFLVALMSLSSGAVTVIQGIEMVIKGQCYHMGNLGLSFFGLGNPVCEQFRSMTNIVLRALTADPQAITNLVAIVAAVTAAPYAAINGVDALASRIDNAISTGQVQALYTGNNIPRLTDRPPQPYGGKSRRKRSSRKKSRKSRAKKSRRNK